MDLLPFYTNHSLITAPGRLAGWLAGLPAGIPALVRAVQGLLLPLSELELYQVSLSPQQRREARLRTVEEMLARMQQLDPSPLDEPRPPDQRLAGSARDFAVLLCSFLRQQGCSARVRAGFAGYLGDGPLKVDHTIVEAWTANSGWMQIDAQVDDLQRQKYAIDFDTLNLPPGRFVTAGQAWLACQNGEARSGDFGAHLKQRGWNFLRLSLLRDFAALNLLEVQPWDHWWEIASKPEQDLTTEERALLDKIAGMTAQADGHFADLRRAFEMDPQFSRAAASRLKLLEGAGASAGSAPLKPSDFTRLSVEALPEPSAAAAPAAFSLDASSPLQQPVGDPDCIIVRGAQQHNLKRIDVTLPRNKLVVLTGVSGSGKSSLAFDTLFAEGQRRYVESLSAYVRRYMDQMDKPKVDYIGGLSPAIAIEQKSVSKNPRSTVGTVTEVLDYLRVLFSRAGTQHCPQCGRAVEPVSPQQIAGLLGRLPIGTRFNLLAPLYKEQKGDHAARLEQVRRDGFTRVRLDGEMIDLSGGTPLPRLRKSDPHTLEIVVDRLAMPALDSLDPSYAADYRLRLIDSVETALKAGGGVLAVSLDLPFGGGSDEVLLSEKRFCPHCQIDLPALTASLFSFNAPAGMCPTCNGLGSSLEVDVGLIVDHPELSLLEGASRWYGNIKKKKSSKYWLGNLNTLADHYSVDLDTPWKDLPQKFRDVILYGSGDEKIHFHYESDSGEWKGESIKATRGIVFHINRLFRQTKSDYTRRWYMSFMSQQPCSACGGSRLCPEARSVTVGGTTFQQVNGMTIEQALAWVHGLTGRDGLAGRDGLSAGQLEVVGEVLKELRDRLQFMLNVGLHYLTLDRPAPSLSGGEGQRIRLASQLGCGLVGVLYILDEPSIGLHARDQDALLGTLFNLRDMGNTVLVVEHDEETMRRADWLVDLGPGAGIMGGEVVAAGLPVEVAANPASLTGRYLSGALEVVVPSRDPRNGNGRRAALGWLEIHGARLFNLKQVTARFPLGALTCVTGVSGSGKSSLVAETLYPALSRALMGAQATPGPYERLEGLEQLDKVINITQDPIGRTPRSNPATYVGVYDDIRQVFASLPEARLRGYSSARFSFNVKGGRCEACLGHGQKRMEMHFLPDVWVTCQECRGTRYNRHTLDVRYKGKNIAEVLDMDVQEALAFFSAHPRIQRVLQTLHDVGLDYVKLGQSATTLSGGEAQRVKLAKELGRVSTGRTIYILDEPTTGLHFADIQRLLEVLHRLVDAGNTVVVIEHNLDVIKSADWLVDLGPEGGAGGGRIIAEGTPEEVMDVEASHTGRWLRRKMG